MKTRNSRFTRKLKTAMVFFTIGFGVAFEAYSQPVVSMPEVAGCVGDKLLLPVYVDDFNDIEAFSIDVVIDTTTVSFLDVEQAHEDLSSGPLLSNLLDNGNETVITIVWFGNSAINLHDTSLLYLNVEILADQAEFKFGEDCELVLSDYTVAEDAVFSDGRIIQWDNLTPALSDSALSEGQSVKLTLPALYDLQYQWQIASGDDWKNLNEDNLYEGTSSEVLSIRDVSEDMRNQALRCILSAGSCTEITEEVELKFAPVGINENDGVDKSPIHFYPNPVDEYLYCRVMHSIEKAQISVYNSTGQRMKQWDIENLNPGQVVKFAVSDLKTGWFMVRLESNMNYSASHKIMINH